MTTVKDITHMIQQGQGKEAAELVKRIAHALTPEDLHSLVIAFADATLNPPKRQAAYKPDRFKAMSREYHAALAVKESPKPEAEAIADVAENTGTPEGTVKGWYQKWRKELP